MVDEVTSRRLAPVYAALDAKDFKGAIKMCDRKDLSDVAIAKLLKAFALERKAVHDGIGATGEPKLAAARQARIAEALQIARQVASEKPADDQLVHVLMLLLRNCGRWEELVEVYAAAYEKGKEQEHGEALMFWYLRTGDFDKMAKLGMAMSKAHAGAETRYLSWTAAVLLVQARALATQRPSELPTALTKLKLAEMVLRKALPGEHMERRAQLLLQVLVEQGKHEDALALLDNELSALQDRERLVMQAEVLLQAGRAAGSDEQLDLSAGLFFQLVSTLDVEDWRNWSGFLEASMCVARSAAVPLEDVLAKIDTLRGAEGGRAPRGPNLARVMCLLRACLAGLSAEGALEAGLGDRLAEALCDYLRLFDNKAVCFGDLRNVLLCLVPDCAGLLSEGRPADWPPREPPSSAPVHLAGEPLGTPLFEGQLRAKQAKRWPVEAFAGVLGAAAPPLRAKVLACAHERLREARDKVADAAQDKEARKKALRTAITSLQVARYLGDWEALTPAEAAAKVDDLVGLYRDTLHLDEGSGGGQREVKVGDDLVLLAAHLIVDVSAQAGPEGSAASRAWLVRAACLLEQAYEHSPWGFQLALMLMEVCARLDMLNRNCELYTKLDIKHIQIDSLSYLVLGDAVRSGFWPEAAQMCGNSQQLWRGSRYENVDYTKAAFRLSNLLNGVEFVRLDNLLQRSHQRIVCVAEALSLDVLNERLGDWEDVRAFLAAEATPHGADDPVVKDRVADLADLDVESGLATNYDWTARVSWDCPLGAAAARAHRDLASQPGFTLAQPRQVTSHDAFDRAWHARSAQRLRLHFALVRVLRGLFDGDTPPDAAAIEGLRKAVAELGLDQGTAEGKNEAHTTVPWAEDAALLWRGALALLEGAVSLRQGVSASASEPALAAAAEALTAFASRAAAEEPDVLRLAANAFAGALLWCVVAVRVCADLVPRRKKKKKNPSPAEAEAEQVLKSIKAATTALLAALARLETGMEADQARCRAEARATELAEAGDVRLACVGKEALEAAFGRALESRAGALDQLLKSAAGLRALAKAAK